MNKGRLEAITDGIIAIAATIGVLELKMPPNADLSGLVNGDKLLISYIISYMIIATCWYSHHELFKPVKVISPRVHILNTLWILPVTLFPFVTAFMGNNPHDVVPSLFYMINLLFSVSMYALLRRQLKMDNPEMRYQKIGITIGVIPFVIGIASLIVIPFYPPISLWVSGATSLAAQIYIFRKKN